MARLKATHSGEKLTAHFGLQLTPSQRAELDRRAAEAGLLPADYARARLFGLAPDGGRRAARPDVKELAAQVARVGNNLNQIALRANTAGQVRSEEAVRAALEELAAVWAKVTAL